MFFCRGELSGAFSPRITTPYCHLSVATATAPAVIIAGAGVGILTEVLQHEELLFAFGKFAFQVGSILRLNELTSGSTFGGNGLLDFAGLHCAIVIQLTELLCNGVGAGSNIALGFAATICDQGLQITLTELGLITQGCDVAVGSGKLVAQIDILFTDSIADAIDILGDKVKTSFIPGGCSCVADRKVSAQCAEPTAAAATSVAASKTAAIAATKTATAAPAEQQQDNQPAPHISTIAPAATIVAIHSRHNFPRVIATRAADGVNRNCFHLYTFLSFGFKGLVCFRTIVRLGGNLASDSSEEKYQFFVIFAPLKTIASNNFRATPTRYIFLANYKNKGAIYE